MTIYDIKRMSEDKAPYFFERKTLKFFNQTLKDFSVKKLNGEKYYISAPMRDSRGFQMGVTKRVFDIRTRELGLKPSNIRAQYANTESVKKKD